MGKELEAKPYKTDIYYMIVKRFLKPVPAEFLIYCPNILIGKDVEFSLMEERLYMEVLEIDHLTNPQMEFVIPYVDVTTIDDIDVLRSNQKQEVERITEKFLSRTFHVEKDTLKKYFDIDSTYGGSIKPFQLAYYKDGNFQLYLTEYFKKLLIGVRDKENRVPFTLGDRRILKKFRIAASFRLYWIITREQWKGNILEIELEELKEILGCKGKYKNRNNNFSQKVLQPIYSEFKNTWAEFDYSFDTIGQGGKVESVKFAFKKNADILKALANETPFTWESALKKAGVSAEEIYNIRYFVKECQPIKEGLAWNSEYVEKTIEIFRKVWVKKNGEKAQKAAEKGQKPPIKIGNTAGYLLKALYEGYYIEEIEKLKKKEELQSQGKQRTASIFDKFNMNKNLG